MNRQDARTLIDYNQWANHRILEGTRALDHKDFTRNLGSSFGGVQGTLVHILWAEWLWLRRWLGESPKQTLTTEEFPNVEALEHRWRDVESGQRDFAVQLTDDRLGKRIAYENLKGERWEYSLGHMIQHTVNHSSYHRGQVVAHLRQLGATAPATDLLVFFDDMPKSLS